MAASKTIGGINVTISATTGQFVKGITFARKSLLAFTKSVNGAVFSMKGLAAALTGGLTVAAFVKVTKSAFEQIDALGELSDKLGVTTERLGGLQMAALDAGVSNEMLEKSLTTLSVKTGKRADVAFFDLSKTIGGLSTQQEKLAMTSTMLGSKSTSMVRMLSMTRNEFAKLEQAAISTGFAMERSAVMGVERAMFAVDKLKAAVSGILRTTANDLAPYIEMAANKGFEFLATNGRGKGIGAGIAKAIIDMTKFVADAIQKMVGGVLSFVAEGQAMIFGFRSWAGSLTGRAAGYGMFKYRNEQESLDAAGNMGNARKRVKDWNAQAPWSSVLQGMADDLVVKAAEQAKLTPSMETAITPAFSEIIKKFMGSNRPTLSAPKSLTDAWNNTKNFWGGALGPMGRGVMGGVDAIGNTFGGGGSGMANGNRYRGISAQDPLSIEGNAQRVRTLGQMGGVSGTGTKNVAENIKKQRELQVKMEKHLERIAGKNNPPLKPANI